MPRRTISLVLLTLLLFSCAKQKEEASSLVHEVPAESYANALTVAGDAKITCADAKDCPENVGLFVGASAKSVSTCTAFLVAKDIVATNSHCIPSAVKLMPDFCAERVHVVFPAADGHPEERFECGELLLRSDRPNEISPDLTLIRLARATSRNALPLNRNGVEPNEAHKAYKMNPGTLASGTIVAQNCLTVPGSYRFPIYREKTNSIFTTGDCPSVPGNSGAPLLNAAGEAVGVFQAELALGDEQRREWEPYLKPGEAFAPLAIGTSLRCLTADLRWNEACAPIEEAPVLLVTDFFASYEPRLEELAGPQAGTVFRWTYVMTGRKNLYEDTGRLFPSCFRPVNGWLEQYRDPKAPSDYVSEASREVVFPVISVRFEFNRYMQPTVKVVPKEWRRGFASFNPRQVFEQGHTVVDVDDHWTTVGLCPANEKLNAAE